MDEVGVVKHVSLPHTSNLLLTIPRQLYCCGSLLPFLGVRFSVTFHLACVYVSFSLVLIAEWPPLGIKLLTWLTIMFS